MSRRQSQSRSRRHHTGPGKTPPARKPGRTPRPGARDRGADGAGRKLIALAGVVVLGLAIVLIVRWRTSERRPESPASPLDATSPESLYMQGVRLGRAGRNLESLPLFERAGPALAGRHWEYHFDYATSLHNLCVQAEERQGILMPAVRTSVERVALMRLALAELERAEPLAATPLARSHVLRTRAQILRFWGLPWDAFEQLRLAQHADPTRAELANDADRYMRLMADPGSRAP